MKFTFPWLQQKIKKMSNNVYWHEIEHEKGFRMLYVPKQTSMQYIRCDQLTQAMKDFGDMPCLVYRKQLMNEHGQMDYDEFNVILLFREKLINGKIRIQENHVFRPLLPQWTYLDGDLYHGFKVNCEHEEALESFNQKWIQSILELPDIRLLAVTGMLEYKES